MLTTQPAPLPRHADSARSTGDELVRRWLRAGKLWLLPLLLSDYGRDLVERKYDAFATDRAYENRPSGRLGPLGRLIDWFVLQQDIHVGLRQRLVLVVDELAAAVRDHWAQGRATVNLVSGPCGLARDLRLVWKALDAPSGRLELLGLDLDSSGTVLPAAAGLAATDVVPLQTARCDLLDSRSVQSVLDERQADIFLCIGLSVWLDAADLDALLGNLRASLAPDGLLIVDNFHAHGASHFAGDLEMNPRYRDAATFEAALQRAGFAIKGARQTRNHVNTIYRCRRTELAQHFGTNF